jgi:hypothetical protein
MANAHKRCYGVDQLCDLLVPSCAQQTMIQQLYVFIRYNFDTTKGTRIVSYEKLYLLNMTFMISEYALLSGGSTCLTLLIHFRFKGHRPAQFCFGVEQRNAVSTLEHSTADGIMDREHREPMSKVLTSQACSTVSCSRPCLLLGVTGEFSVKRRR